MKEFIALAKQKLAELKKVYPNARLQDPEDVNAIVLFMDDPKKYYQAVNA